MPAKTFELYVGSSPDGGSIHPHFGEGEHVSLDEAKAHAEMVTGRRLIWRWMKDRARWRAEADWGKAAEIAEEESNGPAQILVEVSRM